MFINMSSWIMANMPTEGVLQQMLVQIEEDSNNEEEVSISVQAST